MRVIFYELVETLQGSRTVNTTFRKICRSMATKAHLIILWTNKTHKTQVTIDRIIRILWRSLHHSTVLCEYYRGAEHFRFLVYVTF